MGADGHFGKYRGVVVGNRDPLGLARLEVRVPDVLGEAAVWATPCLPFGYVALPPEGSGVWVEFEAGEMSRPIWIGSWWSEPSPLPASGDVVLRSGETTLEVRPEGVTVIRRHERTPKKPPEE